MKKLRNNKGFTLVELLAVIVVLAIVMGIASIAITNLLNNSRKASFVSSAKMYIEGARKVVSIAEVAGDANKVPICGGEEKRATVEIAISEIETENTPKSPYGEEFTGKVIVTASGTKTNCKYAYSIFLSDSIYAIGTADKLVAEGELDVTEVKPILSGE